MGGLGQAQLFCTQQTEGSARLFTYFTRFSCTKSPSPEFFTHTPSGAIARFSKPYLFKPGSRPEIVAAPSNIKYGQLGTIFVKDATQSGSLVLVKLGAETHSFDFGQRLVDLPIKNIALGEQSQIDFQAPTNGNLYPPGYYMMFYLNDIGKPSHAQMVKLEAA